MKTNFCSVYSDVRKGEVAVMAIARVKLQMAPKAKAAGLPRRKSKAGAELPESASHTVVLTTILQDDEDFYREPIKRIVRPENQVCSF